MVKTCICIDKYISKMAFQHWGFTCKAIVAHYISDVLMNGSTSLLLLLLAIMCCPIGNYAFAAVERVGVSDQQQVPSINNTVLSSSSSASYTDMASNSKLKSNSDLSKHQDADNYEPPSGRRLLDQLPDLQQGGIHLPPEMAIMDESISSHKSEMQMIPSTLDGTQYMYVNSIRAGRLRLKRARRSADVPFEYKKDPLLNLLEYLDKAESTQECSRPEIDLSFGSKNVNETFAYYSTFLDNSSIAVYAANLLNSFYSRERSKDSIFYHEQMLYSIVRNIVENNSPSLSGSCIAFDRYAFSEDKELFAPCTYYESEDRQKLIEIDMGTLYNYTSNTINATEWFTGYKKNPATSPNLKQGWLIHRYNATKNAPTENASYAFVTAEDGEWTSPYFDCDRTNRWLVTYSVPFYNKEGKFM